MIDRLQELITVLELPSTLEALKHVTAEMRQLAAERDAALTLQAVTRDAHTDAWQRTAEQNQRNTDYYRSLVVEIGKMLGPEAYRQDDGGTAEDVLCAKVPELVHQLIRERDDAVSWTVLLSPATEQARAALTVRDLAREASNQDLEAKRKAQTAFAAHAEQAAEELSKARAELTEAKMQLSILWETLKRQRELQKAAINTALRQAGTALVESIRNTAPDGDQSYCNGWHGACDAILKAAGQ